MWELLLGIKGLVCTQALIASQILFHVHYFCDSHEVFRIYALTEKQTP